MRTSPSSISAREGEAVRVQLPGSLAPEQAVLWLRDDRRPFALVGEWLGQGAILGSEPVHVAPPEADPFALLDEDRAIRPWPGAAVGGGWVGWLGYGLGSRIEDLPEPPPAPVPRPAFDLAYYDHVIVYDAERWWFEALWSADRADTLAERLHVWETRLSADAPPARPTRLTRFALGADGARGHLAAVAECRERIAAGEIFQANLCVRLEATLEGDVLDLFARALPEAQPRFGALAGGVVSLSPERFLRRAGRTVSTEPIKGTRPRTGAYAERQAELDALIASGKDAAEHVMIVDLMRNDLGRVCAYGSIQAEPPRAEAHAGVWHLVSTVSGRLRDGVGDGTLLRATFPPGSVTGAPKVQAMKVIAALESTRRELYTGAVGIVSPVAGLDLSVAIRTFETGEGRIWFGAGGGIVADSDPEAELAEALDKAAGPVAAIGGRLERPAHSHPRTRSPESPPLALGFGPRPDPPRGVFETLLVQDGRPRALEAHLDRLAASLGVLYGTPLDRTTAERVRDAATAAGPGRHRLRVDATPDGAIALALTPAAPPPTVPVTLTPFRLPGGLGAHKLIDRALLEALAAHVPGTVPLLVSGDGLVLEAAYANLWIVEDGALLTPPADGRILPGVTRAALLAGEPAASEEAITLERLRGAEGVFLTSSIAGRHAARVGLGPDRADG